MTQINQSSSGSANLTKSDTNDAGNQSPKIKIGTQSQAPLDARRHVAHIVAQRLADDRKTSTLRDTMVPPEVTLADLGPARHFTNALDAAITQLGEFEQQCAQIKYNNNVNNANAPFPALREDRLTPLLRQMLEQSPPLDKKNLSDTGEKLFAVKYFIDFALQHETAGHRQEALKKTRRVYTAVIEHTMRHLPAESKKELAKSQTDDHSKASLYHVIKDLSAPAAKAVQKESKGLQRLFGLSDPDSLKRKFGRNSELGPPLPKNEQGPAIALATINAEKPNHQARGWQQLQTMLRGQGGNPATMPAPIGPSRRRFEQQEWQLAKTISTLAQGLPGMTPAMQQTILETIAQRIGDLTLPTRGLVLLDLLECNLPAFRNQIHRLANRHLEAITSAVPYMDTVQLEQAAVHFRRAMAAVPAVNSEHLLTCAFTLMGRAGSLSNAGKRNLYLQLPAILGRLDDLGDMPPAAQKNIMDLAQALVTSNNALLTNNQGSGLDNMLKKLFEVRATLAPATQGQVNMICAPYVERLLAPAVLATLPDNTKQAMIPLLKGRLLQPRGQSVSALLKEIIGALPAFTLPHEALWKPMWAMLGPHLKHLTGPHAGQAATQIPANLNALAAGPRDIALAKLIVSLTGGTVPQPLKAVMINCVTGQLSGPSTPMAQLPYSAAALAGTLRSIKEATLQLKIVNTFDTEIPKITDLNIRGRIKASVAAAVPYLRNDDNKHALQIKAFNTAFNKLNELKTADQEQVLLPLAQDWRELGTSDMRKKMTAEIGTRLPALVKRDAQLVTTLCDSLKNATIPQPERDQLACALIRNSNEVSKFAQQEIKNATQTLLNTENGLITLANDAFKAGVPQKQQQAAFEAIRHELYDSPLSLSEKSNVVMEIYLQRDLLLSTSLKDEVDMFAKGYLETWLKNLDALAPHSRAEAVRFALRHMNNSDAPDDSKLRVAKLLTQSYAGLSIDQSREAVKSISSLLQQAAHKDTDAAVDVWRTLALALLDTKNPPGGSIASIELGLQNLTGERKVRLLSTLGERWNDIDGSNFQKMVITQLALNVGGKSEPKLSDSERLSLFGKLPEDLQKRVKPDDFNALVEHAIVELTRSDIPGPLRKDLVTSLSSVLPLLDQDKQKPDAASSIIENWGSLHLDDKATAKTLFQIMGVRYRLTSFSASQLTTLLGEHLEVMLDHVDLANNLRKHDVGNLAVSKIDEDRKSGKDVNIGTLLKTITIYQHLPDGMKQTFSDCIKEAGSKLPEVKKFELADLILKHAHDILHDQISHLKIEDIDKRFALAMAAVKAKVTTVPQHIDKFNIGNVDQLFQIAQQAANYIPRHLAENYSQFKNLTTAQRSDIVTLLVKSAPESLAERFSGFGIEDQTEIKKWALILAKASPFATLRHFGKFKLQDEKARMEIGMVLAEECPEHIAFLFSNLRINEDKARLAIARTATETISKKKLSISNLLVPYLSEFNIQSKEARTEIWSVIFEHAVNAADATTRDIYEGLVNNFLIYMESDDGNLTEHIPGLIEKLAIDADSEGTTGHAATDKQSIKKRFNSFVEGIDDPFVNATVARWGWYQILQLCRGDKFEKKFGNFDAFIKKINAFHMPPETRYSLTNLLQTSCIEKDGEMTSSFREISGRFKTKSGPYLSYATLFPIPLTSIYEGKSDAPGEEYETVIKILTNRDFKDLKRMAPVINALTTLALANKLNGNLKRQLLHAALAVPGKDKYLKEDVDSFKNLVQSIGLIVRIFENHEELLLPRKINDIKAPKDIEDFLEHLFHRMFKASNVPDLSKKVSKYMSRCREPAALVTYAAHQQNLVDADKGHLDAALHDFFNTVVLADKPETSFANFANRRYDTSLSTHLKKIQNAAPASFDAWKNSMPFDWTLAMITSTAKKWKVFDHLHDQILEHGPASAYPILSEVLENRMTLDNALQTMKDPTHSANENERDLLEFLALNDSQSRTSLQQIDLLDKVIERLKRIPAKVNLFFGMTQLKTLLNPSPSNTVDLRAGNEKPEFLKAWSVVDTDDPEDLLLSGTEVVGSCQTIHTPIPGLNKCLMGYVLDGKYRMLAVKNSAGNIMARRMLRLMWDETKKTPVLYLDRLYVNAGLPDGLEDTLLDLAKQKARAMGVFLVESGGEDPYGNPVISLDSSVQFEYVDELHAIQSKTYTLENLGIVPRYPFGWDG